MRWLALLALVALPAHAVEKTFTWVAPTTNTDGSPLAAAQIAGYTITCTPARTLTVTGPVTSFKADFGPGTHQCAAQARATNGNVSVPSNTVSFVVPQPTPSPPSGFSVSDAG